MKKKKSNELNIGKLNLFVKEFQVNITKIMWATVQRIWIDSKSILGYNWGSTSQGQFFPKDF